MLAAEEADTSTHLSVDSAACRCTSCASQEMKHATGWSASMCVRSLAATKDGVRWRELYASLSSDAVQNSAGLSGFGNLLARAIPACHPQHIAQHGVSAIM